MKKKLQKKQTKTNNLNKKTVKQKLQQKLTKK